MKWLKTKWLKTKWLKNEMVKNNKMAKCSGTTHIASKSSIEEKQ